MSEATPETPSVASDEPLKDATRLVQAVASEEHFLDPLPVFAPLLNLVGAAAIGIEWIVGFFGGPVVVNLRTCSKLKPARACIRAVRTGPSSSTLGGNREEGRVDNSS
jgi:hypothetical protein